jgi:Aerotolerance regulator N-terminal/von Willebrand factor type A domain/CARDB
MSFLGLAFLAALPLAAAPVLLHLFDRRRNVAIEWGAMQFLVEAATRRTRARRFQHWLLLVLRVLCVAALVLALARPLAQSHWLGATDRQEMILVIDNSLSTQRRSRTKDDSGEKVVFDELLSRAEETITALGSGNAVRMLVTSPYPAWVTPASLRLNATTREDLIELLHGLRATQGRSDIPSALLKAVQSNLEDQRLVGRHVVLLTDGQRNDWHAGDSEAWARFNTALHESPVPTTLQVIETSPSQPVAANLAVTRVRTNRAVVGVNHSLAITAEVCNFASAGTKECPVTWFIDQQKVSASNLPPLAPGEKHDLTLKHSFARPGVYVVTCQLDPDDASADVLAADNAESVVITVVERVPVLLVESAGDYAELQQDSYLVRAALGQIEGNETEQWRDVFEPRTIAPEQLDSIELRDFRAVVVPNLTSLSERAVRRLTEFVADGGGLWLALGPRTDMELFNALLYRGGDGLSPVGVGRVVDESQDELQRPTINPFAKSHPATSDLADYEQLDTGEVTVERRFRFQMPLAAEQISVLLDLSNGEPLAVENRLGRGRVLVLAVPLRRQWSGLAMSQAFVVMVHNWLSYLTEPGATQHNMLPGDSISLHVAHSQETHAVLTTPGGEDVAVSGEPWPDGVLFRSSRTAAPGSYALDLGLAGGKIPFHVARDAVESDLSQLTAADRAVLIESGAFSRGQAVTRATGAVPRTAIWPGLLVLLVSLIALELALSGAIARQRFGSEPISETAEELASQESMFVGITLATPGRQPAVALTANDSRDNVTAN